MIRKLKNIIKNIVKNRGGGELEYLEKKGLRHGKNFKDYSGHTKD